MMERLFYINAPHERAVAARIYGSDDGFFHDLSTARVEQKRVEVVVKNPVNLYRVTIEKVEE